MRLNVRNLIIWLLIIAAVVALHAVRRNSTMRGIEVTMTDNDICLLSESDVDSLLLASFPTLLQTDIKSVEKRKIRQTLLCNSYVADADVSMSAGGKLIVKVRQRIPVVRMFYCNREFYISEQGTYMPLCAKHYCDVMVGSCEHEEPPLGQLRDMCLADKVKTPADDTAFSLKRIWSLARFIHVNPRYDGVFDQVSMTAGGDLVLTPKLGNTIVIVGDTSQLKEKFENLWSFYDKGMKKMGWDTYKCINLKYRDQLVCTRRK